MNNNIKSIVAVIVILIMPILYSACTSMPRGTNITTAYYPVENVKFITDLTYEKNKEPVYEMNILQEELDLISEAQTFIVMDFFLFSDSYDKNVIAYPENIRRITDALVAKKLEEPEMEIVLITDPINTFYGDSHNWALDKLSEAGIQVVSTNLQALKDSNWLYSGYYRLLEPVLRLCDNPLIANPLEVNGEKMSIKAVSKLVNFKANHRKLLITDQSALVTSANPHDASSLHSNIAVRFDSPVIDEMIQGENAIIKFSQGKPITSVYSSGNRTSSIVHKTADTDGATIRYITEKGIRECLLTNIRTMGKGDSINMGIFYISDTQVLKELKAADQRGVNIKIIADNNKGAFGIERDGTPNRVVLSKVCEDAPTIQVKWYKTDQEQYHSKLSQFITEGKVTILLGSANYTRRNLQGYNLEADVEITCDRESELAESVSLYFDRIWNNTDGTYTVPMDAYEDHSFIRYIKHIWKEAVGLCTY